MIRAVRAEALKLLTTRALYGLLAGEIAVVVLTTASTIMSSKGTSLTGALHEQVFFLLVSINVGLFSLIIGMRSVTDEYRHDTIAYAFLSDPRRFRTVGAKAVTGAVAGAVSAAVAASVMVVIALPLTASKGGALTWSGNDLTAVLGFVAANAGWSLIGVGVAFVVRHQVPAIVGGLVWVLVIENLGSGFLGDAGRYLPGQAAYALADALDTDSALAVSVAAIVVSAYAAAALIIASLVVARRDVA